MDVIGYALAQAIPKDAATADAWATKTTASSAAAAQTNAAALDDGRIFLVGMSADATGTRIYDPATDTYTTKAAIPVAQLRAAIGTINGIVYINGGTNAPTTRSYDPVANTWTTRASSPNSHSEAPTGVVLNGYLYVIGGGANAVDRYNPVANTWTTLAAALIGNNAGIGGIALGGLIYRSGGATTYNGNPSTGTHEAIDPVADTKTAKATLPALRAHHGVLYESATSYVITAGIDTTGAGLETSYAYDSVTNTWAPRLDFPFTDRWGLETVFINEKTYVFHSNLDPVTVYTPRRSANGTRARLLAYLAAK